MSRRPLSRRRLLAMAAPFAATPLAAKLALAATDETAPDHSAMHHGSASAPMGHAAMIREAAPAVGGPHDLDALLSPPPALPYEPGRVREYTLTAVDREIEIAPGVFYPAWTY